MEEEGDMKFLRIIECYHLVTSNKSFDVRVFIITIIRMIIFIF